MRKILTKGISVLLTAALVLSSFGGLETSKATEIDEVTVSANKVTEEAVVSEAVKDVVTEEADAQGITVSGTIPLDCEYEIT